MALDENGCGFISLTEERAKGALDAEPHYLYLGDRLAGHVDEHNLIHWTDDVTMDDLKAALQTQLDWTRYQVNQMIRRQAIDSQPRDHRTDVERLFG